MNAVLQKIADVGVVPVVKLDSPDQALPLGQALMAGSLPVAEVTFRTDAAEESIKRLSAELPDLLVGAGTVTTIDQAKRAVAAGAKFLVSPGFNPAVVKYCVDNNIPITPGMNSPSQIEQGLELGLSVLKFFPAEQSGGLPMLKAFAGPYSGVRYIPTGGIGPKNLAEYLAFPKVLAVGGSWMVKPELLAAGNYAEVTRLCQEAVMLALGFELRHLGINEPDADAALTDAQTMDKLFGFAVKQGNSSHFAGIGFEFMKTMYLGKNGHIAIATLSVDRAVAYLATKGIKTRPETEKRDASGSLTVAYLEPEVGGFAIHLVKK
ncbi:MAG: bifunctional 4-hydroxy-2-oxoglutarate aldolase/2-dehydro-3-deoxy-phosphogluconate aldolase [Synergistaceae bacterium]|nr:bifunctional 4-hydroxy-2-oxoglutarate aldolase/2-dehydro-3-deoxy-phosphogluconate aldolase [Synergistaceae bacterium]